MKNILFTSALALALSSCGFIVINPKYEDLSELQQQAVKPELKNEVDTFYMEYSKPTTQIIFNTNAEHTKSIIKASDKAYVLLVFYAHWCGPCKSQMPKVLELQKWYAEELNVLYISTAEWALLDSDREYLKSLHLPSGASLVVDVGIYGNKYSQFKRFHRYYKELGLSDYPSKELGLPTYILVKKDLTHLYTSIGIFNRDKMMDLIE